MDFIDLAKARFSVRDFDGKPVDDDILSKIVAAGQCAPTAKNLQPQKVYIIKSRESLDKINSVCQCIYGATTVIMMCFDEDTVWHNPFHNEITSGEIDAAIMLTHMMLEAKDLGIDSCWVCRFDPEEVRQIMGLPKNIHVVSLLPIGYAKAGVVPSERHYQRKRESDIFDII